MSTHLTRRTFGFALCSAPIIAAVAACAPGSNAPATKTGSASTGAATGPKKILWWDYYGPGASNDAMTALLSEYQKQHPDTTIDRQFVAYADLKKTMLQAAGARSLPDVVIVNNPDHQQFAETGIALDLSQKLTQAALLDKYPKGLIASATYQSKIYGLPITANCLSMFYNKKMLAAAGVQPPKNWAELQDTAKRLTTSGVKGLAFSAINNQQAVFQWLPALWQAGGDLTDLKSDAAVEALTLWRDLVRGGSVSREALNWDQAAVKDEFANGRCAMMINGPWQIPTLAKEAPNLEYGVAPLPAGKAGEASALGGENYMITNGPNAEAAWAVITWLQDISRVESLSKATGSLPTRVDAKPFNDTEAVATFSKQLLNARPRAYGARYAEIADVVVIAIQSALSGASEPRAALEKAAAAVAPMLPR